ncbi:inovirus Gp2 family protein [Salmonella enterica subsp. enterica serovar Newport]|nr:inovirus Gp2 family protein [Salmonella enterica subsp. enterica serovar Newport]
MMTHCHTTPAEAHLTGVENIRKVLQQATDQYPRLAAFLLTLPVVTQDTVQHFHDVVYQQIRELVINRQLSGRPVQPTILRWIWASPLGQTGRMLLLLNQDTFCHPRYDRPPYRCFETMETLLRDAVSTISDARHHQPPEIIVFRVDRTQQTQADTQYSRLRECALSLAPAATARSERISP